MATLREDGLIIAGIALAVMGMAWYAKTKVEQAGSAVAEGVVNAWDAATTKYLNPVSEQNIVNQAAEGLWHVFTGSTGTIGGDVYDYVHKGEPIPGAARDPVTGLTPAYNYTVEQQAADLKATRQLEAGFHGM
jgi:hypothetical protein